MNTDGSGGGRGRDEATRWLEIAERLLRVRDLVGCKRFAERAMEADPALGGGAADQLIAAADVLLASQRRVNNQVNWYAVLQLDPTSPSHRQRQAIRRQYSRLAFLLHPDRNHLEGTEFAAKLVADAWTVLSDPSKKALFDAELDLATAASAAYAPPPYQAPPPDQAPTPDQTPSPEQAPPSEHVPLPDRALSPDHPRTFWTACFSCYYLHQYDSDYEGKKLRCPKCGRAFHATPLQADPPIVPDVDMYYCSWGFIPLGFPGGISDNVLGDKTNLFRPMFPTTASPQHQNSDQKEAVNAMASTVETTPPANKVSAAKSVEATPEANKESVPSKKSFSTKKKSIVYKNSPASKDKTLADKPESNSSKRFAVPEGRTRSSERIRSKLADAKAGV